MKFDTHNFPLNQSIFIDFIDFIIYRRKTYKAYMFW